MGALQGTGLLPENVSETEDQSSTSASNISACFDHHPCYTSFQPQHQF